MAGVAQRLSTAVTAPLPHRARIPPRRRRSSSTVAVVAPLPTHLLYRVELAFPHIELTSLTAVVAAARCLTNERIQQRVSHHRRLVPRVHGIPFYTSLDVAQDFSLFSTSAHQRRRRLALFGLVCDLSLDLSNLTICSD
jgi:hypothetical protein